MEQWIKIDKKFHIIFYCIIILFLANLSFAQESIHGVVINVTSGDIVTVWEKEKQYKIKLYGIDTPEKKQAFGMKAKKFTANMVFNKSLTVLPKDIDQYGRIVGVIYIAQKCLNEELVKNGLAWVYKKYCSESFCDKWLKLEKEARENKFGLWIDTGSVSPWDFKKSLTTGNVND